MSSVVHWLLSRLIRVEHGWVEVLQIFRQSLVVWMRKLTPLWIRSSQIQICCRQCTGRVHRTISLSFSVNSFSHVCRDLQHDFTKFVAPIQIVAREKTKIGATLLCRTDVTRVRLCSGRLKHTKFSINKPIGLFDLLMQCPSCGKAISLEKDCWIASEKGDWPAKFCDGECALTVEDSLTICCSAYGGSKRKQAAAKSQITGTVREDASAAK